MLVLTFAWHVILGTLGAIIPVVLAYGAILIADEIFGLGDWADEAKRKNNLKAYVQLCVARYGIDTMAAIVGLVTGYYALMALLWLVITLSSPVNQPKVWQKVYAAINAEWPNWLDLLMVAVVVGVIVLARFGVQKWAKRKVNNVIGESAVAVKKWKW